MIKLQCDLCGNDTKRQGFNLMVSDLDCNYESNTTLLCTKKTFLLCPACYKKLNLPNIYEKKEEQNEQTK